MITEKNASTVNGPFKVLRGLSTESKPTDVANGTEFVEINTGKKFLFNEAASAWVEQPAGGTSDYSDLTNKPSINGVTLQGDKTLADLGSRFVVTLTNNGGSITADKTFAEIKAAYEAGKCVVCYFGDSVLGVERFTNNSVRFSGVDETGDVRPHLYILTVECTSPDIWSSYEMTLDAAKDGNALVVNGHNINTCRAGGLLADDEQLMTSRNFNKATTYTISAAEVLQLYQLFYYLVQAAITAGTAVRMLVPTAFEQMYYVVFYNMWSIANGGSLVFTDENDMEMMTFTIMSHTAAPKTGNTVGNIITAKSPYGVFGNGSEIDAEFVFRSTDITCIVHEHTVTTVPFPS